MNDLPSTTHHESSPAIFPAPPISTVTFDRGPIRWKLRAGVEVGALESLLRDPDRFLTDRQLLIADSALITLGQVPPLEPNGSKLVLRRLNYGRWRHRLRDLFRATRAERAFRHGLELERAGVNTPRNIAVGVERVLRWPRRAYLLTEWVPEAVTLQDWLARHQALSRAQVYDLADLLAGLHRAGFSHRDLKASNVLFDRSLRPWLIDLDGIRRLGLAGQRRAVSDLARLAWEFARYPRVLMRSGPRFLKRYCAQRAIVGPRGHLQQAIMAPTLRRRSAGQDHWK